MNRIELNQRILTCETNIQMLKDEINRIDNISKRELLIKETDKLNKLLILRNSIDTMDNIGDEVL